MKREANVNKRTKKLVVIAMMIAIVEILTFTPIGMIPIPPISATTAHIPVIIATILEGVVAGMFVGLALGVTSIIRAMSSPNMLDLLFINPLVSVLPRMLIAVTTYLAFIILKKILSGLFAKGMLVSYLLAACIGSMTNTVGCMGMMYIIYAKRMMDEMSIEAWPFVISTITTYGIAEMIVAAIITAMVTPIIKNTFYK